MFKHFTHEKRIRGQKLFKQGQSADYIYIVKEVGELQCSLKQFEAKPDFKDVDTKAIFEKPWQANSQHSEHMTKNT